MAAFGSDNEENRRKWVIAQLKALPAGIKLLDAGAGEQQYRMYCGHLEYVAQDKADYTGPGNGQGLQMKTWNTEGIDIVSDINQLPVPDKSFDAVLCTEVLEHIPYPVKAIEELGRVLKPGGTLILTAPFCSLTHFAPEFYYTGFSKYFYVGVLGNAGFRIEEISENGDYFSWLAQELKRLPGLMPKYAADEKLSWLERFSIGRILKLLAKLSRAGKGSQELLCYGLHIRAVKVG